MKLVLSTSWTTSYIIQHKNWLQDPFQFYEQLNCNRYAYLIDSENTKIHAKQMQSWSPHHWIDKAWTMLLASATEVRPLDNGSGIELGPFKVSLPPGAVTYHVTDLAAEVSLTAAGNKVNTGLFSLMSPKSPSRFSKRTNSQTDSGVSSYDSVSSSNQGFICFLRAHFIYSCIGFTAFN